MRSSAEGFEFQLIRAAQRQHNINSSVGRVESRVSRMKCSFGTTCSSAAVVAALSSMAMREYGASAFVVLAPVAPQSMTAAAAASAPVALGGATAATGGLRRRRQGHPPGCSCCSWGRTSLRATHAPNRVAPPADGEPTHAPNRAAPSVDAELVNGTPPVDTDVAIRTVTVDGERVKSTTPTVDADLVKKTAGLASLDVTDEEVERLLPRVQSFLGFVETMDSVDTSRIKGAGIIMGQGHALDDAADQGSFLREDQVHVFPDRDGIMANMPEQEGEYLRVPRVGNEEP